MKKTETYEQKIERLISEVKANGHIKAGSYLLVIDDDNTVIEVRNADDGLVAFSSMKGDFEPSLREFVEDYFA